jgi:toxin ParE1/3/4
MGWPVILTEQAQNDLREIIAFICRDSSQRSEQFGNKLIDQALSLGDFPEMGRTVPEHGDPAVREIVHGAYRIVYELLHEPDAVYVLRFWHSARGTPELPNT